MPHADIVLPTQAEFWGLHPEIKFHAFCDGEVGPQKWDFRALLTLMDVCWISPYHHKDAVAAVLAGNPLRFDGAWLQFKPAEERSHAD